MPLPLEDHHHIDTISERAFADLLKHYPDVVPSRAHEYDDLRYAQIPKAVASRKGSGKADLGQMEVINLVNWKLSHGTFRPKLKQLVQSNPPDVVQKTTAAAFASFDGSPEKLKSSLAELSTLKGIGPATASLLLSVAFPDQVPFFSDELFRWAFWEDGKGKGWDRPIKYTPKEYLQLYDKVQEEREKHGWAAVDMEKTAFVLGVRSTEKRRSTVDAEHTGSAMVAQAPDRDKGLDKSTKKRTKPNVVEPSPPPAKKAKK